MRGSSWCASLERAAIEPLRQLVEQHQAAEIHDDAFDAMHVGGAERSISAAGCAASHIAIAIRTVLTTTAAE